MPPHLIKEIEDEVTNLLKELIRLDTTNPPGNETKTAKLLEKTLTAEGFNCDFFESSPNRGNIITNLKGAEKKPRLLLLSHLDVVGANSSEWTTDPFGGVVKDGFVWGRGALDMKGMTAIEVVALKLLKRNKIKLKGDVILAATADEEKGGLAGVDFLLRNYPEKIFAEYVLNEGGGASIPTQHGNVYTVNTTEKGLLWFKIKTKGTPGHGSMPYSADNAIMRMNQVISKLGNYRGKVMLTPTVRQLLIELAKKNPLLREPLNEILKNPQQSDVVLDKLKKTAPNIVDEIQPRLKMTITPTIVNGGSKENVIPSECSAVFDGRLLPGQSTSEVLALIKYLLKDVGNEKFSIEIIQAQEPSESSMDTFLYDAIKRTLKEFDPKCGVAPILMTGGTDSRFFRKMGSICYGFHPLHSENQYGEKTTRREHGIDERISVENLVFGVSVLYETIKRFLSAS